MFGLFFWGIRVGGEKFTMFQLFKKGGRGVGGLLLGIQLLVVFLIPINAAQAQAATTVCPWNIITMWGCMASNVGILGTQLASIPSTIGNAVLDKAAEAGLALLVFVASLIFKLAGFFFTSMAIVLDLAIASTISTVPYKIPTILVAWTAVRDLSNMLFIFVLLFIAIQTILGLAGGSAKRWLSHVIIAALLINFSLFLTGVVIDAGNVLAMGFWNKMQNTQGAVTGPSASMQLMQGLKLQTTGDMVDPTGRPLEMNPQKQLFAYLGGTMVMLVAGYVFLAGAVMMIIRTVTLMILMIVSPFAFLGFALPKGGGFANEWLQKLISSAFVAPAFLAMLYIDSLIINSPDLNSMTGANSIKLGSAFAGDTGSLPIIYHYVLVIILILASLTVANKVSSGAGSAGGAMAKRLLGGGAAAGFAGAAAFGRQTGGAYGAQKLKDEEWVKEQNRLIAKGGMQGRLANYKLAAAEKAKKGSFDIRNAPMGGLGVTAGLGAAGIHAGAGSKRNYGASGEAGSSVTGRYRGTDKEKELMTTADERFKNDPVARKAYLEQRGVELSAARNKDASAKIERDLKKKAATDSIENQTMIQKNLQSQVAAGTKTKEIAAVEGAAIAAEVGKAMKLLSVNERAELAEKYHSNEAYLANMNKADLAAVHRMEIDGKFKAPVMGNVSQGILNLKGDQHLSMQQYVANPETQDKLFTIDASAAEHYNVVKDRVAIRAKAQQEAERKNKEMSDVLAAQTKRNAEESVRAARWQELVGKGVNRNATEEAELSQMDMSKPLA